MKDGILASTSMTHVRRLEPARTAGLLASRLVATACLIASVAGISRAQGQIRYEDSVLRPPSPAFQERFGDKIAHDGEWLAVGIPLEHGSAFHSGAIEVHRRVPGGFRLETTLVPSAAQASMGWPESLDLEGNLLVAGTHFFHRPYLQAGIVYVYEFDGTSWREVDALQPRDVSPTRVGFARRGLALAGETIVVGRDMDPAVPAIGAAIGGLDFFDRSGSGWRHVQRWRPINAPGVSGSYGWSVDSDGQRVLTAGFGHSTHGWMLRRSATGEWVDEQILADPAPTLQTEFGFAVAVEDDLAVIGAPTHVASAAAPGRVVVYRRVGTTWVHEQTMRASDAWSGTAGFANQPTNDRFGYSVDIEDGRILVGAEQAVRDLELTGAAYVFEHDGNQWVETTRLWHRGMQRGAAAGVDITAVEDTVVVGARFLDAGAVPGAGGVLVYHLPFGAVTCPGRPNSTGLPATLEASGSRSASLADLGVHAYDVPPGAAGYFLASTATGFVANPGGSQGDLCLSGAIARFGAEVLRADARGRIETRVALHRMPTSPPSAVQPGDTWTFQLWYRDANPAATTNFSEARSVTFD